MEILRARIWQKKNNFMYQKCVYCKPELKSKKKSFKDDFHFKYLFNPSFHIIASSLRLRPRLQWQNVTFSAASHPNCEVTEFQYGGDSEGFKVKKNSKKVRLSFENHSFIQCYITLSIHYVFIRLFQFYLVFICPSISRKLYDLVLLLVRTLFFHIL